MTAVQRIPGAYDPPPGEASWRALARALGAPTHLLPAAPLERAVPAEGPDLAAAVAVEEGAVHAVVGAPVRLVDGFLDGTQASHVVRWVGGAPVVYATLGAVALARVDGVLRRWGEPVVRRGVFAPLELLDPATREALRGFAVTDVPADAQRHPLRVAAQMLKAVGTAREAAERAVLNRWVAARRGLLYLDGPLPGSVADVLGVVKAHRVLYTADRDAASVLDLPVAHRTTVMEVRDGHRPAVWTWYLRLRHAPGDPFHGLVRVEVAPGGDPGEAAASASRSVLAERVPLARPDGRWHVMPYGIAQCETLLKRGLGLAA